MKSNKRKLFLLISLLLFPVTINYFSPYLIMMGATEGIVSGSFLVFSLLFLCSVFFGRIFCSWVCPAGALGEIAVSIQPKPVKKRVAEKIKYIIFVPWILGIVVLFLTAGGIAGINPFYMTESIISVAEPFNYIIYYSVVALFFLLALTVGKRGGCHTVCWMAPIMNGGKLLGKSLHLPQLHVKAKKELCISCGACSKVCPMSIHVSEQAKLGSIKDIDCIVCGECIHACLKDVLHFGWKLKQ